VRLLLPIILVGAVGCGGSGEKAVNEPKPDDGIDRDELPTDRRSQTPDVDDGPNDGLEVKGLKGRLEPYDINKGIQSRGGEFNDCHIDRIKGKSYIGGKVKLKFTVGPDGAVQAVHLMEGDLGAFEIETCVLEVAGGIEFARPKGGNGVAEFDIELTFSPKRATLWWDEDTTDKEVAKKLKDLAACAPRPDDVWITFYAGTRGQVTSAGFASKQPVDPAWAACASAAITKWTVTDPRGQVAKGSFRYGD
jgi:hypothetical protein